MSFNIMGYMTIRVLTGEGGGVVTGKMLATGLLLIKI